MKTEFHQQLVWPLAIRLIHWILVVSLLVLLVTGWLMSGGLVFNPALHDWLHDSLHVPTGQLAAAALAGRILLLATLPGVAGWRALMPGATSRPARAEMFRFYLAFGRREMPGFYAYDPVWAIIYLVLFAVLAAQVFTGFAIASQGLRLGMGLSLEGLTAWHTRLAVVIAWISGLHVASVLLREIRGRGYEVSSMLHGYRLFGRERGDMVDGSQGGTVGVPLEQLLGSERKDQ